MMELNNSGHCILQMETNDINIRSEQAEMWRGINVKYWAVDVH